MTRPIIGITTDIEGEYLRLKHRYSDAIIRAGGAPVLIPPTGNPVSYAERIDGLLISGGDDLNPSYYNEPIMPQVKPVSRQRSDFGISLLKEVVNRQKPVLGICYGMQLINVAFGGTLYQDIDSQLSVEINHRKDYHIIVITENRFLKKGRFSVNSTHHQAVKELGTNLKAFVYSTDNLIEAFYMEDYPFLVGVQWHPERLIDDSLSSDLFNSFVEASKGSISKNLEKS
ncbi:MAG: gamma-glutamyl-gamma-aminobutyrate hydrolase family protein [Nitrospirae bacterium]|nr:gamma-glutamyl-gamma-aminobutyrate hydrolase family protein [Nitrospirota bacterium]